MNLARRRRRLLLRTALAVAVTAAQACGGDSGPAGPSNELAAVIDGPSSVFLPFGGQVVGSYSAENSTGDIERYHWRLDGESVGAGVTLDVPFSSLGSYDIALIVEGATASDSTTLTTSVRPEGGCSPEWWTDTLAFFSYNRDDAPGLYLMNGEDGGVRGPIYKAGDMSINMSGIGLEPCGNRIVIGLRGDPFGTKTKTDLYILNRDVGVPHRLTNESGIEWQQTWSSLDWIVYLDDTRWSGGKDELYLMRPDGTERSPLAGAFDEDDERFTGWHPFTDPSGTLIVLGSVLLGDDLDGLAVYHYLNGNPTRLHTRQQFLDTYGTTAAFEGANGGSWSPDSTEIAYNAIIEGEPGVYEQRIYVTSADGSTIRYLTDGLSPVWSSNSDYVWFRKWVGDVSHIFRIPRDGGTPEDMSAKTKSDANDETPVWVR